MLLTLYRYRDTGQETFGVLMVNGVFECYTLEDTYRYIKVKGRTRIPEGSYQIVWHQSPKFGASASKMVKDYIGMPMLKDVPGFKYILMHVGNTKKDTDGCILVGRSAGNNRVLSSRLAFQKIYEQMVKAFISGEPLGINIIDLEV